MSWYLILPTLFLTIIAALAFGIAASYALASSFLVLFGHRSQPARERAAALVESHAHGD